MVLVSHLYMDVQDTLSCSYDPQANSEDGSCTYPVADNLDCDGSCLSDTDGDGVCDEDEVSGCTDITACNFDALATDDASSSDSIFISTCIYPTATNLDCNGGCINDVDGDGVCDEDEVSGCTDSLACNFEPLATQLDYTCVFAEVNYDCSGNCINDEDDDGVCDEDEVSGCMDSSACNFNSLATDPTHCDYLDVLDVCGGDCTEDSDSDGVCDSLEVIGCTDSLADNYNPEATDEGGCEYNGCTDSLALNYDSLANTDDGSCVAVVEGCMNELSSYYNPDANVQDNTCEYIGCTDPSYDTYNSNYNVHYEGACGNYGCTYDWAWNFDSNASIDDASCEPHSYGCTDSEAFNYDFDATTDNGSCVPVVVGCMDESQFNYNPSANTAGDCTPYIDGCTDTEAFNYNADAQANTDDGSCIPVIYGCTEVTAENYVYPIGNPLIDINTPDSAMCVYPGCISDWAFNYDTSANTDDGSCYPVIEGCTDENATNFIELVNNVYIDVNTDNGSCIPVIEGCMDSEADNYIEPNGDSMNDVNTSNPSMCEYHGCVSDWAYNHDSIANVDDGSCYPVIMGCTDSLADNFIPLINDVQVDVNTDDESCIYLGCIFEWADNYLVTTNPNANHDANENDGSCFREGCMSEWADNYDSLATQDLDDVCYREGCMVDYMDNYDSLATQDSEDVCFRMGCTANWADNYDELSTYDDGSCYREGCMVDYMDNYDSLSTQDSEDVCYREGCMLEWADNYDSLATQDSDDVCFRKGCMYESMINYDPEATIDDGSCNAELSYLNEQISIATLDSVTHYQNAINTLNEEYSITINQLESEIENLESEIIVLNFQLDSTEAVVNNLLMLLGTATDSIDELNLEIELLNNSINDKQNTITQLYQLINDTVADYEAQIQDLISYYLQAIEVLNESHDSTVDSLMIEVIDLSQSLATLNLQLSSCELESQVSQVTNDSLLIVLDELSSSNILLSTENISLGNQIIMLNDSLSSCESSNQQNDNLISNLLVQINNWQDSVSVLNQLNADCHDDLMLANQEIFSLQHDVSSLSADTLILNGIISDLEDLVDSSYFSGYAEGYIQGTIDGAESVDITTDNGAVYASGFADGVESVDITIDNAAAINSATAPNTPLYNQIYSDGVNSVVCDPNAGYDTGYIDGYSDGTYMLDSLLAACNEELMECENNPQNVPIEIDLLAGWNNIGYTLSAPQDIVSSFELIDDDIEIVKNNLGETYWPQFGYNGIGDLIPGQGYQLRLTQAHTDFVFEPCTDCRISLTPTVPQWAIDMDIPVHPNDIRTLVRVVNLSGQEVNPEYVKGEVLLYLYNDGTVEKKLNN